MCCTLLSLILRVGSLLSGGVDSPPSRSRLVGDLFAALARAVGKQEGRQGGRQARSMKLFDVAAARDILALFLPSSLQMLTDWTRPLIFNLFVSRSIANSMLPPEEATLEEDAVGLAVMSLNLIMFATAYGFNGAIDSYASVAFGAGKRTELFAVLARQGVLLCGLCVPALLLLANAEHILLFVGLQPPLAERTARLLQLMGWAIPGDFACEPRLA